jgi:hypothetical protein
MLKNQWFKLGLKPELLTLNPERLACLHRHYSGKLKRA